MCSGRPWRSQSWLFPRGTASPLSSYGSFPKTNSSPAFRKVWSKRLHSLGTPVQCSNFKQSELWKCSDIFISLAKNIVLQHAALILHTICTFLYFMWLIWVLLAMGRERAKHKKAEQVTPENSAGMAYTLKHTHSSMKGRKLAIKWQS